MPLIAVNTPMAAAGVFFPLQGNQYEFLPFDALVEFATIIKDLTGTPGAGAAKVQVYSGSDLLAQDVDLDTLVNVNNIEYPEHYQLQDVAGAGERLSVQLSITTLDASQVAQTRVRITPV